MHRLPCRSLQRQTGAEQLFNRVPTLPCGALRRQAWSSLSTVLRSVPQGIVQQARCDRVHNLPGGEVQRRGWLRSPRLQDLCLQILRQLRGPSRQHVLSSVGFRSLCMCWGLRLLHFGDSHANKCSNRQDSGQLWPCACSGSRSRCCSFTFVLHTVSGKQS